MILGLILAISFLLRVWDLNKIPAAMYWDEMDVSYQAYSILKTGKDYYGNFPFPVVRSFADYRAPFFIYSVVPFVAIFGLNEYSVRIPAAIFGVFSVLLIYLVSKKLFKSEQIALASAFFMAFSPWNIQYSRLGFEITLMIAAFLAGILFFLNGRRKSKFFILSALFFGISVLTYNTAKLFIPFVIATLFFLFAQEIKKDKNFYIASTLFILLFLITLYGSFFSGGGKRFSEIAVWTDPQMAAQIDILRSNSSESYRGTDTIGIDARTEDKIIYNKISYSLSKINENYYNSFSPQFLFISGDPNTRHSPERMGELYRIEFITIIFGLIFLLFNFKKNKATTIFIFLWLLIAPIPAALTQQGGVHASRLAFLQPVLTIISALGVIYIFRLLSKKLKLPFVLIFSIFWFFGVLFFLNYYFGVYKIESAKQFQYGFSEAAKKALVSRQAYDYVIIDDRRDSALMNYLIASNYDPNEFRKRIPELPFVLSDQKAAKLDNVLFFDPATRDWASIFTKNTIDKNFLLIVSAEQFEEQTIKKVPEKLTRNQKLLDIIYQQNGAVAFYVIQSKKPQIQ